MGPAPHTPQRRRLTLGGRVPSLLQWRMSVQILEHGRLFQPFRCERNQLPACLVRLLLRSLCAKHDQQAQGCYLGDVVGVVVHVCTLPVHVSCVQILRMFHVKHSPRDGAMFHVKHLCAW